MYQVKMHVTKSKTILYLFPTSDSMNDFIREAGAFSASINIVKCESTELLERIDKLYMSYIFPSEVVKKITS